MSAATDANVAPPAPAPTPSKRHLNVRLARVITATLTVAVVAVALAYAFDTDGYLTVSNGKAILLSASIVGILALGETVIMISGRLFSLSLATSSAIAAMTCVSLLPHGFALAVVVGILVGVAINAFQGWIVGGWGANPVIVTIAAGGLETGIGASLTGSHQLTPPANADAFNVLAEPVLGIPVSVYVFVALAVLLEFAMRRTRAGVGLYLMGNSLPAARAAGLRTVRLTVYAFTVAGLCAGIAGILLASANGNASLSLAGNNTYGAITAALVGGTLVTGGSGSVLRTLIGAIGVTAISDLVLLRGYSSGIQILVEGVLIMIAIVIVHVNRTSR
jgi:ribose/xylose/arabinose/galactoside ABC-type transport system permease subunit